LIKLEVLNERNVPELQELLIKCSDYLTFQDGEPVKKDAANDLLLSKPDNVSAKDKIVFGIYKSHDHSLVGVIEIVLRYAGPIYPKSCIASFRTTIKRKRNRGNRK